MLVYAYGRTRAILDSANARPGIRDAELVPVHHHHHHHHGANFQLDGMMDREIRDSKKEKKGKKKDNEIFENSFAFVKRVFERSRADLVGLIALPAIHSWTIRWKKSRIVKMDSQRRVSRNRYVSSQNHDIPG